MCISEVGICHGQPIPIQPNNTQPGILPSAFHNPAFQTSYSFTLSHLPTITLLSYENPVGKPKKPPTSLPTEESDYIFMCVGACAWAT